MSESTPAAFNRRTLFATGGALGALGALGVVAATRGLRFAATVAPAVSDGDKAETRPGGYQLTDHVKQYYATARV